MNGMMGNIGWVDLTTRQVDMIKTNEADLQHFLGGYGLGAKILYESMPANTHPYDSESVIGFVPGITNGTSAMFGGRYMVVCKSPVTMGFNDTNSGGFFGPELKKAGFDALFVKGIADTPVYLHVTNEKIEIRDAKDLWGLDAKETWTKCQEIFDSKVVRVACIGSAGENVSKLACIINDGHRAAGRGGAGAVMGSKKLKAIAVLGTMEVPVADKAELIACNKEVVRLQREKGSKTFADLGTGAGTPSSALSGDSPVKNWDGIGVIDYGQSKAEALGALAMDKYKTKKYHCSSCPLGCGAIYQVDEGRWPVGETERPEYETAAAFGSTLLNGDVDALIKCNEICNRAGLDTISTGMTIAWAMECYEKGVLTKEKLDGIDLTWGNGEAIVHLTEKMARGEGIGSLLAHGSLHAASELNIGFEAIMAASGIELPMHDPRYSPGLARTYQYDPTPGRHVKGGLGLDQMGGHETSDKYDYRHTGKDDVTITAEIEVINSAGYCLFGQSYLPAELQARMINAILGTSFTTDDLLTIGKRIYHWRHAFNVREELVRDDFSISARTVGIPAQPTGPLENVTVDHELLGDNFFEAMGIDPVTFKSQLDVLLELKHTEALVRDQHHDTPLHWH